MVELVGGGSVINEAYPVYLINYNGVCRKDSRKASGFDNDISALTSYVHVQCSITKLQNIYLCMLG